MSTTTVHPLELRVGQRIRFNRADASQGTARQLNEGPIAAKTLEAVLIETGVTLAGTKVLRRIPNDRITGVWLDPPAASARTLVPVSRDPGNSRRCGGLLSRIFRDTPAALSPVAGAYSLNDDRAPWAS
jgi:hypothetical protein